MVEAALLALTDALSPPFRAVLLKSIGVSLLALVVIGALLEFAATELIGFSNDILTVGAWVLTGIGILAAAGFLMPTVVSAVASFYVDEIAAITERTRYPAEPEGRAMSVGGALVISLRFAVVVLVANVLALVLLLVPGINVAAWWLANGYLLGRLYFELAALRFHPYAEATALRRLFAGRIFVAGLLIAAFVAIPIVNLATPLVATAFMVHVHKDILRRLATGGTA